MPERVSASPSKLFFVQMLTRDIDLKDAILDLLDNCIDGLMRQRRHAAQEEKPYDGYWAKITAQPEGFSVQDNCGGIPQDIAINSAFRLGRPNLERDADLPTIGMYGIGMKRALFKMGTHSLIESKHEGDAYYVDIPAEWLNDDDDWDLTLTDADPGDKPDGTTITIMDLYERIALQFDSSKSNFLRDLANDISNLFALIIDKGFAVYLNNKEVKPTKLQILAPSAFGTAKKAAIQPYLFRTTYDEVEMQLAVGFYREPPSPGEVEDEQLLPRTSDNAGWTVICNDRVVLSRDKSAVTGWGLGNVPKYHTQFIAIAGVVRFSSTNSYKLPLNTTKRGLDTSSPVYLYVLNQMMEGLKQFTNYTNRWKGREAEALPAFRDLRAFNATEVLESIPQKAWSAVRGSDGKAQRIVPHLPDPPQADLKKRIVFFRDGDAVQTVGAFLFGDPNTPPSEVGARCFDDVLERASRASE